MNYHKLNSEQLTELRDERLQHIEIAHYRALMRLQECAAEQVHARAEIDVELADLERRAALYRPADPEADQCSPSTDAPD